MTAVVSANGTGRQTLVVADRQPEGWRCQQQQRQQSRSVATTVARGIAAVAVAAVAGFPRADAFFAAPPSAATPCSVVGAGKGTIASASSGVCRGYGGRRRMARMSSGQEAGGDDGDKPQFVPSKEMTTSTKEIIAPPDREAAMQMVAEREAKQMTLTEEDAAYNSADVQDLPKPPYIFKTPGEFENDTLCTDPKWHTALLAFKWLGLPYEVQHDEDEDEPILVMGDEEYDEPEQLMAGLPERVLLSDFVESNDPEANAVAKLEPAWKTLHFNKAGKADLDTDEKRLGDCLQRIENILLKHGPARGPFLEGDELTLGDLTLAVSTYHMLSAFDIEKQWTLPKKLVKLKAHMDLFHGMQMFEMVLPSREDLAKKYALDA
ncbi:unnamed protein product [Scytosiphon promiscuus]